jgi:biopolymer transport protein ExbD
MGMQVGEEKGVKKEPNVVPMIDIMLVLLIIFMIVTPVIASGFTAEMPLAKNIESRPDEDNDIVLGMDVQGCFYLDPGTGETGYMPGCPAQEQGRTRVAYRQRLEETLRQIYETRTKDKILFFRADRELPFGQIQDAIEAARAAGVAVLATVTEEIREERGGFLGGGGR